jgi:hypothetical protein
MSDSDTEAAEAEFDSKEAFFEAVKNDGAVLGAIEYFTEGSGSATSYKARTDDGEVEDVKKSDVEAAWEEHYGSDTGEDSSKEDEGPKEQHLGTFYFSKANWDTDRDRETLEELLDGAGWYIDGEVDSGGYRIKCKR